MRWVGGISGTGLPKGLVKGVGPPGFQEFYWVLWGKFGANRGKKGDLGSGLTGVKGVKRAKKEGFPRLAILKKGGLELDGFLKFGKKHSRRG